MVLVVLYSLCPKIIVLLAFKISLQRVYFYIPPSSRSSFFTLNFQQSVIIMYYNSL